MDQWQLLCLFAFSSECQRREVDVQFPGIRISAGPQVDEVAEAPGTAFGQLDEAVNCFDETLGNALVEIISNAGQTLAYRPR